MFTGIIEEIGTIKQINQISKDAVQIVIQSEKVLSDVALGDSISVNGVCLTVTHFTKDVFQVDVMPETIKVTSLQGLTSGSKVNLERAMAAGGRFGGHFVSGHVDAIGKITNKQSKANAIYYDIEIPREFAVYVMLKGSITIDGISLTVFGVNDRTVTVSLIPHTAAETILGDKGIGNIVNIECDLLAKYVQNMLVNQGTKNVGKIDATFLTENGFN